jgi:ribonuclease VapC
MVIDSSAIFAIFNDEPERQEFDRLIEADTVRLISAATVLEAGIVIESRFPETGKTGVDSFLRRAGIEIVSFDHHQAEVARNAYRIYGKGRHAAGLNFGDCFAYALSIVSGEPLLYKGTDFDKTDVEPVSP